MPKISYTREQLEAILDGGGSVIHNFQTGTDADGKPVLQERIVTRKEDLPTEADLAKGDPEAEKAAASDLQAQIDALNARLAQLKTDNDTQTAELDSLRVGELRARAKAQGVEGADGMGKAELILALGGSQ